MFYAYSLFVLLSFSLFCDRIYTFLEKECLFYGISHKIKRDMFLICSLGVSPIYWICTITSSEVRCFYLRIFAIATIKSIITTSIRKIKIKYSTKSGYFFYFLKYIAYTSLSPPQLYKYFGGTPNY